MSTDGNTHWCYHCQSRQQVRVQGQETVCHSCNGGFVQELDELPAAGLEDLIGSGSEENSDQSYELMEAFLADFLRQRMAGTNPNFDIRRRPVPWLLFERQPPIRMSENNEFEGLINSGGAGGLTRVNIGDYFSGPGMEELIEQLTVNDRRGPPPAPQSSIDAIPTIKIMHRHLITDSHCPICKDRFELDSEARQMPCNHIYHSDCIVPWLVQHNSCPVCRHELPPQNSNGGDRSSVNSGNGGVVENRGQNQGRRNFWPSRSSNRSSHSRGETGGSNSAASDGNHEMNYTDRKSVV